METAHVFLLSFLLLCVFAVDLIEAGFGCPLDQMQCHNHCQSVRYRGGYCTNFLKMTCKCYG
uniref:Av-LCTX-An1a n=1 Tax=Alopecosa nagpag TaxID=2664917 RepID=A0A5Q1NCA8_9ARAC|nr:Av-LCTX-An1a [Alopecosa nagpag]